MKQILLLLILFSVTTGSISAQDTLYFSKKGKELKTADNAYRYKVIKNLSDNTIEEKLYSMSGQIKHLVHKRKKNTRKLHGIAKYWHKEGSLMSDLNYRKGKKHGLQLYYWEDGTICRKEIYKKGKLKKGECWNRKGEQVEYFPRFIQGYLGKNRRDIIRYIEKHTKYPEFSQWINQEGKVLVRFEVDSSGNVIDARIVKSISQNLDNEALRVVNNMPKWTPSFFEGEPVKTTFTIPINFKLVDSNKKKYSRGDLKPILR